MKNLTLSQELHLDKKLCPQILLVDALSKQQLRELYLLCEHHNTCLLNGEVDFYDLAEVCVYSALVKYCKKTHVEYKVPLNNIMTIAVVYKDAITRPEFQEILEQELIETQTDLIHKI